MPVWDEFAPHLQKFIASLEEETVRCEIDLSDDRFGKKIRNASKSKAPFILIVGEEDMNNNAVSFRFRDGSQLNGVPVDEAKAEHSDRNQEARPGQHRGRRLQGRPRRC